MIRWYDYVLAVLAADIILSFLIMGVTSTELWLSALSGIAAGLVYNVWKHDYCQFRLKREIER